MGGSARLLQCLAVALLLFGCHLSPSLGIRVLRSLLQLEDADKGLSGAKLLSDEDVSVTDLTVCVRFKYKLLGPWESRSQVVTISDWKTEPKVCNARFNNFYLIT